MRRGRARAAGRGPASAGRGGPRAAPAEGALVAWGIGATAGCAGLGPGSKGDDRRAGSWVPGWEGGPGKEVMDAGRKIDFCLERKKKKTKAEKGFEVSLELTGAIQVWETGVL